MAGELVHNTVVAIDIVELGAATRGGPCQPLPSTCAYSRRRREYIRIRTPWSYAADPSSETSAPTRSSTPRRSSRSSPTPRSPRPRRQVRVLPQSPRSLTTSSSRATRIASNTSQGSRTIPGFADRWPVRRSRSATWPRSASTSSICARGAGRRSAARRAQEERIASLTVGGDNPIISGMAPSSWTPERAPSFVCIRGVQSDTLVGIGEEVVECAGVCGQGDLSQRPGSLTSQLDAVQSRGDHESTRHELRRAQQGSSKRPESKVVTLRFEPFDHYAPKRCPAIEAFHEGSCFIERDG